MCTSHNKPNAVRQDSGLSDLYMQQGSTELHD